MYKEAHCQNQLRSLSTRESGSPSVETAWRQRKKTRARDMSLFWHPYVKSEVPAELREGEALQKRLEDFRGLAPGELMSRLREVRHRAEALVNATTESLSSTHLEAVPGALQQSPDSRRRSNVLPWETPKTKWPPAPFASPLTAADGSFLGSSSFLQSPPQPRISSAYWMPPAPHWRIEEKRLSAEDRKLSEIFETAGPWVAPLEDCSMEEHLPKAMSRNGSSRIMDVADALLGRFNAQESQLDVLNDKENLGEKDSLRKCLPMPEFSPANPWHLENRTLEESGATRIFPLSLAIRHEPTSQTWCPSSRRAGCVVPVGLSFPETSGVFDPQTTLRSPRSHSESSDRPLKQTRQKPASSREPSPASYRAAVPAKASASGSSDKRRKQAREKPASSQEPLPTSQPTAIAEKALTSGPGDAAAGPPPHADIGPLPHAAAGPPPKVGAPKKFANGAQKPKKRTRSRSGSRDKPKDKDPIEHKDRASTSNLGAFSAPERRGNSPSAFSSLADKDEAVVSNEAGMKQVTTKDTQEDSSSERIAVAKPNVLAAAASLKSTLKQEEGKAKAGSMNMSQLRAFLDRAMAVAEKGGVPPLASIEDKAKVSSSTTGNSNEVSPHEEG